MSLLLHGDCLEHMKNLEADSVDLVFCDLPYGQTSCKWDCPIDLDQFWIQIMRIKKLRTPIFMTTTTKFGVSLIQSAPKKCPFRYDIVWAKSAPCGFLSAKKMPMRKHEMIYVFYEKLPFYDLSSHQHKFLKPPEQKIIKEGGEGNCYNTEKRKKPITRNCDKQAYDPPLPVSIVKEEEYKQPTTYGKNSNKNYNKNHAKEGGYNKNQVLYDPPLPVSVVKEGETTHETIYGDVDIKNPPERKNGEPRWEPPLPVSVVKEDKHTLYGDIEEKGIPHTTTYDPPLPTTMLEIKSTRGKHSTEKPVALMEWIFKYYSKEGDVVLDPTMGSGSTGVACKNMNRNFIGIEMNDEIFEVACGRIES